MPTAQSPKQRRYPTSPFPDEPFSFAVTLRATIGFVEVSNDPADLDMPPHVAAFGLIARHDTPGTYEFPMANGDTCIVEVQHVPYDEGR